MQRFVLTLFVASLMIVGGYTTAVAQHGHHHGHGHHHHGHHHHGYFGGGGLGYYSNFSVVSPGFGAFGIGRGPSYLSFGWDGPGLNYYYGPVGGYITPPIYSGYPGYSYFNPGYGAYGPAAAAGLPVAYPPLPPQLVNPIPVQPDVQIARPDVRLPAAAQAQIDPIPRQTNAEAKLRSLRVQTQGDEWFAKQNYLQAQARYKQAIAEAPDLAEPRFRLGYALAALGYFPQAAAEFKRGMKLDPTWPVTGDKLDTLYGKQNGMAKESMLHKAALWVQEDVRDPDRLFLMGALLHFNNDRDRSQPFLLAANQVSGSPEYVQAFLKAQARDANAGGNSPAPNAMPRQNAVVPEPLPLAPAVRPTTPAPRPQFSPPQVARPQYAPRPEKPVVTAPPAAASEQSGPLLIAPQSTPPAAEDDSADER